MIYIQEGIRVVTIAYQLYTHNVKKNVKFAASIFRKMSDKEVFVRKQHSHTAKERLLLRPLWTEFSIPDKFQEQEQGTKYFDTAFYEDLKQHLRKEVHKRGTGSKQRLRRSDIGQILISDNNKQLERASVPVSVPRQRTSGSRLPVPVVGKTSAVA